MKTTIEKSRKLPGGVRQVFRLVVGAGLLGAVGVGHAAWVVEPAVQVDSRYDDNVQLRPDGDPLEQAGFVTTANTNVRVRNATEISDFSAILGGALSRYSAVQGFEDDTRETFFGTVSGNRALARGSAALTATYRRMDVIRGLGFVDTTPQGTDGTPPDDPLDPGGDPVDGSTQGLTQRDSVDVSPSFVYQATLRTALGFMYKYSDQSYSNVDPTEGFQDFRSNTGSVQLQHAFSERDTASVSVSRAWMEPEVSLESNSWQAMSNWTRLLNESTTLTLGVGAQQTENDLDDQTGSLYEARVQRRLESGTLDFSVERAMVPNAYGDVAETDRVVVAALGRLTDRWSASLRLSAYTTEGSLSGQSNRDQDYVQVRPELRWSLSERWMLRGGYSYTWVDRKRDPESAASNAVTLAISYRPPRRM